MPIFEVERDGKIFEVDAPNAEAVAQAFAPQQEVPVAQPYEEPNDPPPDGPGYGALSDSVQGVKSGLTFGFGDEILAGAATPFRVGYNAVTGADEGKGIGERFSEAYDTELKHQRNLMSEAEERSPVATTVGEVAGGVATGGQLAKGGATLLNTAKATYPSMVGRGAAEGAAYGAAHGFGSGEGGFENRASNAAAGGAVGALAGGAVGAVGARGAERAASRAVPTTDQLKAASQKLYEQADNAGLTMRQGSYSRLAYDLAHKAKTEGIDQTIHPKASAALKRVMDDIGKQPTLQELDTMRRVLKSAASSIEPDERRIAMEMIERFDDYLLNLKPNDVAAGDARAGVTALRQARDLWSRAKKSEVVEDLVRNAQDSASQFSGSGYENALRTQFRQLSKNQKRMRLFTKDEQASIRKVARGGPLENAMRFVGKFAPTGVVSAGISGGTGAYFGGPIGAMALPAAGFAARQGATALTARNARLAGEMMRSGGQRAIPQLTSQQRAALELLMRIGVLEAPRMATQTEGDQ